MGSAFFLASISDTNWIPRICVVKQSEDVIGIVYAKEKKVGPFRTGVIYADATLDQLVIASPQNRQYVLESALHTLIGLAGVRGLRVLVRPDSFEFMVIERVVSARSIDACSTPAENHFILPLTGSYDGFLSDLGPKTRHDLRYYRRRFGPRSQTKPS